ncbi:MAG: hypothetical protein WA843_00720, partial [Candidatus Saccharimonadales bacterium]
MNRRIRETIPERVIEAAAGVGQKPPLFYAGIHRGRGGKGLTAHEVILEGRRRAGIEGDPDLPPLGPPLP